MKNERILVDEAGRPSSTKPAVVRARLASGHDMNLRIRLVPGAQLAPEPKRCQPRHRGGSSAEQLLPPTLLDRLATADSKVIAWLAADQERGGEFVRDPVRTLQQAGIELSRAEQKAIARAHHAVRKAAVTPPGTVVQSVEVATFPGGRIGRIGRIPAGAKADDHDGSGCGKEV